MSEFWLSVTGILINIVDVIIIVLEAMGIIVIVAAGFRSFYGYLKGETDIRLRFAQAMATSLEFKLAGEILRTVIVRDMTEIAIVASIILLRAFMAILIHWEIKTERKACEQNDEVAKNENDKKPPEKGGPVARLANQVFDRDHTRKEE